VSSFLIFAVPVLFLGPLALCLAVFRLRFPKHTLKISQTLLVPLAIPLFIISNFFQIHALKAFIPIFCADSETLRFFVVEKFFTDSYWQFLSNIGYVLSFYLLPVLVTALVAQAMRKTWEYSNNPDKKGARRNALGRKIGATLLNQMGALTAFHRGSEELMLDIYSDESFLFCGKYLDYFLDSDGALQGVSITNVIRFRVTFDDSGTRIANDASLIPNEGVMYFSSERIRNLHAWKLKKCQTVSLPLTKQHHSKVIAWYLSLKYALEPMQLTVKMLGETFDPSLIDELRRDLEKLRLDFSGISFE
jgi:hypothetical protein